MKLQLKNIIVAFTIAIGLTACSSDDSTNETTGNGALELKFDNIYGDADLIFNVPYTNSNGEVVKINKAIYIISNVVLTKEDGTTYTVPKEDSYFFINEEDAVSSYVTINIPDVPAANYTKVSFGVGVDEAQFLQGQEGQGNLLERAQALGMTWSWAAGYKFVRMEGTYTSSTVTDDAVFMVHTGKTGEIYNYAQIEVNLPDQALVRTNITPQVHIMADLQKIIDNTTVINFDEGTSVMGGTKVQNIMANNVPGMFHVDHVHND